MTSLALSATASNSEIVMAPVASIVFRWAAPNAPRVSGLPITIVHMAGHAEAQGRPEQRAQAVYGAVHKGRKDRSGSTSCRLAHRAPALRGALAIR